MIRNVSVTMQVNVFGTFAVFMAGLTNLTIRNFTATFCNTRAKNLLSAAAGNNVEFDGLHIQNNTCKFLSTITLCLFKQAFEFPL